MKIEIENLQGHFKKLMIEIPAETVGIKMNNFYRELQKNAELKGFRKGKAPLNVVREVYGDNAKSQLIRELVEDGFRQAIMEHQFQPLGNPEVNVETLLEGVPFKFQLTFENTPPVNLVNYTGFKTAKSEFKATDEELLKALESVRSQIGTFDEVPPETTVQIGHHVQIDYNAEEAGKAVPEGSEKDAFLETGSGQLPKDFEQGLVGMKAGETKTFTVKIPMPENPEEKTPLSGRTLDFTVSLKSIRKKNLPELTDELAKKIGPFDGLEALRTRVREDLVRQKEANWKREAQEKAVGYLIENNPVEAPETMVNAQMEQLAIDAGMQLSQMGLAQDQIEERLKGWGGEISERAVRMVKTSLLLSAIAKKENIQATDDDLRNEIMRIAAQSRKNPKDVVEDFQKRGVMPGLIRQVTELKALDWIVGKAT